MTITCLLNFIGENPDPSGPSPIRVFATAPGTSSWSQAVNAVSQAVVDFYVAHGFQILARDVSVSDFR